MKRFLKGVLCIVGIISMIGGLMGCRRVIEVMSGPKGAGKNAKDNESGIVRFYYHYNGSIGGDSYDMEIALNDQGECELTYDSMRYNNRTDEPFKKNVDKSVLEELTAMYKELRLAEWNGFDRVANDILDGSSFTLEIDFADNGSLGAHGSNCFPERYRSFLESMNLICDPLIEELCEDFRQSVIAKGISGKLHFVMANFTQRGASGSDRYEIILSKDSPHDSDINLEIKSVSGEFLPVGEYSIHRELPESYIDFEGMQALMEKYDVIQWYDYDKSAEDFDNKEWFQVEFMFDGKDDLSISAMGSKHPENYEEFRRDFLTIIAQIVEAAEELPEE